MDSAPTIPQNYQPQLKHCRTPNRRRLPGERNHRNAKGLRALKEELLYVRLNVQLTPTNCPPGRCQTRNKTNKQKEKRQLSYILDTPTYSLQPKIIIHFRAVGMYGRCLATMPHCQLPREEKPAKNRVADAFSRLLAEHNLTT